MAGTPPLHIIYLAGWGRSGSTLIGNLLGAMPGAVHIGELWNLWEDAFVREASCTCGVPYYDCELWGSIFRDLGIDEAQGRDYFATKLRELGTRAMLRGRPQLDGKLADYAETQLAIYRQVAERKSANIIVDSSKTPNLLHVLAKLPGLRVSILHIVRDPRAVAYSWHHRAKLAGPTADSGTMAKNSPVRSTAGWMGRNYFIAKSARDLGLPYVELRYEDFVADPPKVLESVARRFSLDEFSIEQIFKAPDEASHSIRGNPIRFQQGEIRIRPDNEWQERMPLGERLLVSALAAPLLHQWGYGIRG